MDKTKQFSTWFSFLSHVNLEQTNIALLLQYFNSEFLKSPENFFHFVIYFKKELHHCEDPDFKIHLAKRHLYILSQLCERFQFFQEKKELDDICFKITNSIRYEEISTNLAAFKENSKELVEAIISALRLAIETVDCKYKIIGRYKNIYSIHRKIAKKRFTNISKLNDLFAFRIITQGNSVEYCFEILNLLHEKFYPVASRFKDYISIPKINGYQSLHTGLINVLPTVQMPIEVQICTEEMDNFAQVGVAAHWLYDKKKQLLADYYTALTHREDEKKVYFQSFNGDIYKLEKGASLRDFARHIHSALADKVCSGLVNGQTQDISYQIQECDIIKLLKYSYAETK